jgi:hypothetical protein
MLFVLLVALASVALAQDNDSPGAYEFSATGGLIAIWIPLTIYWLLPVLEGVSVFNLVVVYLGGRFSYKCFNDRTIENSKLSLSALSSMTALNKAVIIFLSFAANPNARINATNL